MANLINDLLESPPWVIITFIVIYTLALVFAVWKISSWYKGISGWNKQRSLEKNWKDKVAILEKEIAELREKKNKDSTSPGKFKK